MKAYLVILILVLCFTCWVADPKLKAPPNPQGIGIKQTTETPFGVQHQETMIPNFTYTEASINTPYITRIEDNSSGQDAQFPLGIR